MAEAFALPEVRASAAWTHSLSRAAVRQPRSGLSRSAGGPVRAVVFGTITQAMSREKAEQDKLIKEYELRRKAKAVVVPTDDAKVRTLLRQMGEPITLFGEKEMERRERLRKLIASQDAELAEGTVIGQVEITQVAAVQTERFFTEGPPELQDARQDIAQWSLRRAAHRLATAKRQREDPAERAAARQTRLSAQQLAKHFAQQSSEVGDDRPIAGCEFSQDGTRLITCGWGGMLSCWSVGATCKRLWAARAHDERCTGVAWRPGYDPHAMSDDTGSALAIASASVDSTARLISDTGKLLRKLEGHTDRLGRLAFHPMGRHLATASFDMTWRFWDVESGQCLLEQEGHSRAVYTVGFHPDGSLAASAGLDAIARLWDCRTGRSPWALEGHIKQILSLDFAPGGYQLITGSDDHTCKVWDLRQRKCLYTIPAHSSLVSTCRYERQCGGAYIVTGGYDNLVKVWSGKDFSLIKTLAGHEGKVMCVDVHTSPVPQGEDRPQHLLASVAYDRTLKLWAPEVIPDLGGGLSDDRMIDE